MDKKQKCPDRTDCGAEGATQEHNFSPKEDTSYPIKKVSPRQRILLEILFGPGKIGLFRLDPSSRELAGKLQQKEDPRWPR